MSPIEIIARFFLACFYIGCGLAVVVTVFALLARIPRVGPRRPRHIPEDTQ